MCLAVPVEIIHIDGDRAEVEISGVKCDISIQLTPEARVGDYVLLHTGYAISIIDAAQAEESLAIFKEMAEFDEADR